MKVSNKKMDIVKALKQKRTALELVFLNEYGFAEGRFVKYNSLILLQSFS